MSVAAMLLSRGDCSEPTQNSGQLVQNIGLLPAPMMSRISGYQHVSVLKSS
jgi:hypothetical protein